MSRIKGIRKKMSQELGFLVQPVHIRDNLQLAPNSYRIILSGVPMGEAELQTKMEMAINPGTVYGTIQGLQTKDPAFGLEAWWIEPGQKDHAQTMGYTVVDSSTVCATHLSHILENNSHLLLGHEEVQQLLDALAKSSPKLVENLVPDVLPLSIVVKVLQNLLSEGVSLRDMRTIVEVMAEVAPKTQETKLLTMHIREALSRMIVQKINGMALELPVMTFDPMLEQILQQSSQASDNAIGMEPGLAEKIHSSLMEVCKQQEMKQEPCVLLLSPEIRSGVAKWLKHSLPSLHVLSYNEVPEDKQIRIIATVGNEAIQIAKQ
jgi:flagellar biosynthesis protein FlhA